MEKINMFSKNRFLAHLQSKRIDASFPFVLSVDCDRTLVDRSKGAHYVSKAVENSFKKLQKCPNLITIINTGRDYTSYQPLKSLLSHGFPCLFLAGRVMKLEASCVAFEEAIFSNEAKEKIWELFEKGVIPFLDVKHAGGNVFFISNEKWKLFLAPYRPRDWFKTVFAPIYFQKKEHFFSLQIVRVELPILPEIFYKLHDVILRKDNELTREYGEKLFPDLKNYPFQYVPIPANRFNSFAISTLRLMISNQYINKGIGLKKFQKICGVPFEHFICCGDSNDETASDCIIKKIIPNCTMCLLKTEETPLFKEADFILESAEREGVVVLFETLLEFLKNK